MQVLQQHCGVVVISAFNSNVIIDSKDTTVTDSDDAVDDGDKMHTWLWLPMWHHSA